VVGVEALEGVDGVLLVCLATATSQLREALEARLLVAGSPLTPLSLELLVLVAERGPVTASALSRLLGRRRQALRRPLDALASRGWLRRQQAPGRPGKPLRLTAPGRCALRAGLHLAGALEHELFVGVGTSERALVLAIVQHGLETRVRRELQRLHPPGTLSRW
jgi:DNA-binding MarR family transcriptional regulator